MAREHEAHVRKARHAMRLVTCVTWQDRPRDVRAVASSSLMCMGAKFDASRSSSRCEAMRPPKGQPWARWDVPRRRDALMVMCEAVGARARSSRDADGGSGLPLLVTGSGATGPPRCRIQSPDAMVPSSCGRCASLEHGPARSTASRWRSRREQLRADVDRPGDAARRALPVRELRPPLRSAGASHPAPELGVAATRSRTW